MSSIKITITPNDVGNPFNGVFTIMFNDGANTYPLELTGILGVPTAGYFELIPFSVDPTGDIQAPTLGSRFWSTFKNIGGNNNIDWRLGSNDFTITAKVGTFVSASYTGVWFGMTSEIDNTPQVVPLSFSVSELITGSDCGKVNYRATLSGGTAPYTLLDGTTEMETGWDGSANEFTLKRGTISNINVRDSVGATASVSIVTPRQLAEGDFKVNSTNYETNSDLLVERVITIANTAPLEYSIDPVSSVTGSAYQSSNAFQAVDEGQYKIFIKDKFGCEISKIINVTGFQDSTEAENPMYFSVAEGQSFVISELPSYDFETKKNYFNTGSYNQPASARYRTVHILDKDDPVKGIQIKSSFDYHAITLHDCVTGNKTDVPPILIQENLGATEKMDCVLFEVGSKTGVYFQGGNTYIPDTDNVLGTNTYNGSTPRWAEIGQLVFLDALGGFRIESAGFDSDRGGYFVLDVATPTETNSKIQVTYNRHDYNLFEFFVDPDSVVNKSFLIIEKGFDNSGSPVIVGNPWVSEFIQSVQDTSGLLNIQWSDTLNKGDIVYQSGITFGARMSGELNPIWSDEAETESGDTKDTSIVQKSYMGFELLLEGINQKQVTQLSIASALQGFTVNNLVLVRKKAPEITRYDKSNIYSWKCEFGFGDNKLAIKEDEIVFSPSTGVDGGGGTGKNPAIDLTGITLFKDQDGNIVQTGGELKKL